MQRRVVEGLEDRQVHVFVVVDIAVSAGADGGDAAAKTAPQITRQRIGVTRRTAEQRKAIFRAGERYI